jgi:hypothetical protein
MSWMKRACSLCIASQLWLLASCDPVQDDAIAALGDEVSGVNPGPTHRPGQPCLLCHDGAFNDPPAFSIAGTVFQSSRDKHAANGAAVALTAADGSKLTLISNVVGNFYVTPQRWTPAYPVAVTVSYRAQTVTMTSNIGRDGACASCHVDPAAADSPGHVYAISDDAGVDP